MAKGFLPVNVELPCPVPTKLLVPDDLSLSLIIFLAMLFELVLRSVSLLFDSELFPPDPPRDVPLRLDAVEPPELRLLPDCVNELEPGPPPSLISGYIIASNLNCSIL